MTQPVNPSPTDFIRDIIDEGLRENKHEGRVATRFPPEPNGYIHIGHAKSVCLNFGIAAQYQGTCNLRLDDTDPLGESMEYVQSIIRDVRWLGFDWGDRLFTPQIILKNCMLLQWSLSKPATPMYAASAPTKCGRAGERSPKRVRKALTGTVRYKRIWIYLPA